MTIAEGSAASLRYKKYTTATMAASSIADRSSDPGNTAGQVLRRVSVGLQLRKNATRSQEIRTSRQVVSSRHTSARIEGSFSGELSPGTYFDFIEAVNRDTRAAFTAKSESDYTSLAADEGDSTLTLGGGDPVADGLRVFDVIQITGASVAGNNQQYVILGFSGGSNRVMAVYPAPADMTADTAFGLTRIGRSTEAAASAHVKRKFLFERYNEDLDLSRIYEENRITGLRLGVPAEGNATLEVMVMGRKRVTLTGGSAPFFGSPTAETTTDVVNTLTGFVYLNGARVGLITSIQLNATLSADAPRVLGQAFPPDILLGTLDVNGEVGFLLDDADTAATIFENETEVALGFMLTAGAFATGHCISVYMPRVKLNSGDENVQGEGSQQVQCQFQALQYVGSTAGVPTTTIRVLDTAASG